MQNDIRLTGKLRKEGQIQKLGDLNSCYIRTQRTRFSATDKINFIPVSVLQESSRFNNKFFYFYEEIFVFLNSFIAHTDQQVVG